MIRRLALLLLAAATPAAAQRTDDQLWLQANGTAGIGSESSVTLESIARFGDQADGLAHTEIGALVTRRLGDAVEIGIGYRHVEDYDHGRMLPNEERLRQQLVLQLGGGFATRFRFEQRFNSLGPQVGVRLRPQLRFTAPIGRNGLGLFASHESFLNFNDTRWGQRSGYERMRHAVGLTVPMTGKLRGEVGYLNQYRPGRDGARDQMDHAATFNLTLTL